MRGGGGGRGGLWLICAARRASLQGLWEVPSLMLLVHAMKSYLKLTDITLTGLELGLLTPRRSRLLARVATVRTRARRIVAAQIAACLATFAILQNTP